MRQSRSSGSLGRGASTAKARTERAPRSKLGRRARQIRRQNGTHNSPSATGRTVCGDDLSWTDHSRRLAFNRPKDADDRGTGSKHASGGDGASGQTTGHAAARPAPMVSRPVKPKFRKGQEVSVDFGGVCAPQSLMAPSAHTGDNSDAGMPPAAMVKAASVLRVRKGDGRATPTTYDVAITHTLALGPDDGVLDSGGGSGEGGGGNSGTSTGTESPLQPSAQLDCICFGIEEERMSPQKLASEGVPGNEKRKRNGPKGGAGFNMSFRDEPATTHVISPRSGSETPAALALVLTSRLRRHLRRSWCGEPSAAPSSSVAGSAAAAAATLRSSPTRRPPFAEPGLWRLLCSDPPSSSFESADDRREEASHATAHLKQILDAMEFGELDDDGDTDGTNTGGEDTGDDGAGAGGGDSRKSGGSGEHAGCSNSGNQDASQHAAVDANSNAAREEGAHDDAQEGEEENELKQNQEQEPAQKSQSAEENSSVPLTATKWMPGDANYPGEANVVAKPQMVVPASATDAAAITNVDDGDEGEDEDTDEDDDEDEVQGTDKQNVVGSDGDADGPKAVKERAGILSAMEASTVALELRVLLSACWRAALPPPPPPGSLRPQWSGCNYWNEANSIILRAWRLCPQEHRPAILDAVARTAPATDEIDYFFKDMFPTPRFAEGLTRQAKASDVTTGTITDASPLRMVSPTKLALKQLGVGGQHQADDVALFGSSGGQTPADLIDAFVVLAESLHLKSNDDGTDLAKATTEAGTGMVANTSADQDHDDRGVAVSSAELLQFFSSTAAIDIALGVDMDSALSAKGAGDVPADDGEDRSGPCRLEWLSLLHCCAVYHQCVCDIQKAEDLLRQALSAAETSAARAHISLGCARAVLHRRSADVICWMQQVRLIPVVAISTVEALVELLLVKRSGETVSPPNIAVTKSSSALHRLNHMLGTVAPEQDGPATLLQIVSDVVSQVDPQLWKREDDDADLEWVDWHLPAPAIEAASARSRWPSRVMQKLKAGPGGLQSALPCGAAHDTGVLSQLEGAAASGGPPGDCVDKAWQAVVLSLAWQGGDSAGAQTSLTSTHRSALTSLATIRFLDCIRAALAGAAKARLSLAECHRLRDQLRTDTRGVARYEAHLEAATGYEPRELRKAFRTVQEVVSQKS